MRAAGFAVMDGVVFTVRLTLVVVAFPQELEMKHVYAPAFPALAVVE